MEKLKIQAEGKNSQAAYNIVNQKFYGITHIHARRLCDWLMIGAGIFLLVTLIAFSFFMHDFVASLFFLGVYAFGSVWFIAAFTAFLFFEYGIKEQKIE